MRHSLTALSLIAVCAAVFFSCGLGPLAGGSGTETTNSYVVLADNTPAEGAIIRVIDPAAWIDSMAVKASPVMVRVVADRSGFFSLDLCDRSMPVNIQIDHMEQGLLLQSTTLTQIAGDTLRLMPYASYTGSFSDLPHSITQIYFSGSTYQASLGSNNTFFFSAVAPGSYMLVGISGAPSPYRIATCGALTLSPGMSYTDTDLNQKYDRLLVDNFESGIGPTSLGGIAPELWWYTVSDSGMLAWKRSTNTWKWYPYSNGHTFTSIGPVPDAEGGTAVRFTAVLSNKVAAPIATAGIFLKDHNENGLDLSAMNAIVLRARGTGTVRVRFETKTLDSVYYLASAYTYLLQLTDTWQERTISIDSLEILDPILFPYLYPWSRESRNVLRIEFEFSEDENEPGDTLRVEVDDISLEGVGVEVLERE
ncbi:MAG: hypothetical protein JW768_08100 [Chitinispirillaceae bacterium]|nr:hypothetical protein [Chitinispirillaceae bacterium]